MRQIGYFSFPDNREEAVDWKPTVMWSALSMRVLCAAQTRVEGAWAAYCKDVPGVRHSEEYKDVLRYGDKLSKERARAIFPAFADLPYAD